MRYSNQIFLLVVFCCFPMGVNTGCHRQASSQTPAQIFLAGKTMGTTYAVRIVPDVSLDGTMIAADIKQVLSQANQQMSTYIPDSEISKFNASQSTNWFPVSRETAEVVQSAIKMHAESEGAFDATVGPLIAYWGFGSTKRDWKEPDKKKIQQQLQSVGTEKLQCRLNPPAIKKTIPQLEINLSAIAKGDAVDRVCELLDQLNAKGYLVEIGGEMRVAGTKSDRSLWILAIESPAPGKRKVHKTFQKTDCAVATSGDYRNFITLNGKRYSHTIDPRTGFPVTHQLGSVTVIAKTCRKADAIATSLMVMGLVDGYNWAEKNKIAALFLVYQGEEIVEHVTSQFSGKSGQ